MVIRLVPIFILWVFLMLLGCTPKAAAADRAVTLHWGTHEGLPHTVIKAIVQTPDGCLWVGTQEGLSRFDGDHFTTFTTRNAPELVSNNIYDLKLDGHGTLWIHTNRAVSCYRRGVFTDMSAYLPRSERIVKTWIGRDGKFYAAGTQLYRDDNGLLVPFKGYEAIKEWRDGCQAAPDGTVWLGTDHGSLYQFQNGKVRLVAGAKQLGAGNVNLDCDTRGTVWLTSAKGFFRLSKGRLQTVPAHGSTANFAHAGGNDTGSPAIVCDGEDNVWACDGTTLFQYQQGIFVSLNQTPGAPAVCSRIGTDADGHFFALGPPPVQPAPRKDAIALYYYETGRFIPQIIPSGMLPLWAFPVCVDRDQNLWAGTLNGLELHHPALARTYTAQDGLPAGSVGTLAATNDSAVWMGTSGTGLWRFVNGHFQAVMAPETNHTHVSSLMHDTQGALWAGISSKEVYRVGGKPWTNIRKICQLLAKGSPVISSVVWGPKGEWAASTSAGLVHLVDGRYVFTDTCQNPVLQGTQNRLFIDRQDKVWALGPIGFACFDGDHVTNYGADQGLEKVPAIAVCEASDGTLWFGLWGGGLARVKDGRMTVITYRDGLYSDMVYGIVEDSYDSLWLGTGRGICRIALHDLNRFAEGFSKTIPTRPYGSADGADGGEVIPALNSSVCKDKYGRLWFSCAHGLVEIDPRPLTPTTLPVLVEDITVDDASYAQTRIVEAPPGEGQIAIQYSAVDFTAPDQVQFRYQLEGYDNKWIAAGNRRSAFYTKLPPGTYSLLLQATDTDGHWNTPPTRVTLTLKPHFYQTLWFVIGRDAAAVLLLLAAIGLRLRQIKRHTQVLEQKVAERTELLEQAHEEVLAQNDELQNMQVELEVQNEELSKAQETLALQYEEVQQFKEDLRLKNIILEAANSRLADLATIDGLTGLKNHRAFQERLEQEWTEASRYQIPFSVLLLDVDQFKHYNDTFGHLAGDNVLRQVGQILQDCARDTDFVARYGGEEFVVILPHTDVAGACVLAERYHGAIADAHWPHRAVTISIGASARTPLTPSQAVLLDQADQALYESKEQGRNRVARWVDQSAAGDRREMAGILSA